MQRLLGGASANGYLAKQLNAAGGWAERCYCVLLRLPAAVCFLDAAGARGGPWSHAPSSCSAAGGQAGRLHSPAGAACNPCASLPRPCLPAGVDATNASALYASTSAPYYPPPAEVTTNAAAPEEEGSSTNVGMIVGISVGCAAALACAAGAAVVVSKKRKAGHAAALEAAAQEEVRKMESRKKFGE